ncbi:MAG: AarF/ABC1/UbiB kinase family protein [Nannocystaceae bacterium]|nr:AarF/ABC1/UbiB kinase family protein [Nannocystaceae bacterium]
MATKRPSRLSVAWTASRLAGRRLVGRRVGAQDTDLGELLTSQLDQMKGMAMKLGQIASYMDIPLPREVLSTMSRLQSGQQGMDPQRVRAILEDALGGSIETLFDAFEIQPVAAASIGQVHRAKLAGRELAVKVQYPGVADTFQQDLGPLNRIASLASLASSVDGKALVRELGRRLGEECDYLREAQMQAAFATAFADDPAVHVPAVVPQLSVANILTSAWVEGDHFDALRTCGDQARIDKTAAVLLRFSYRSLLNFGFIQADPHPGNFIFERSGRVTFLDFGCVRQLEPAFVAAQRSMTFAVRDRDMRSFRKASNDLGLVGQPKRFDFDHFFMVMEHLYRPLMTPHFRYTREYTAEGMRYNGPTNPNARALAIPPAYVWVMRLQWGLSSILAQLGAQGSFHSILDDVLESPMVPMPVPPRQDGPDPSHRTD